MNPEPRARENVDQLLAAAGWASLQFSEAFEAYRRRLDKEWSLTDCASFALMRERGLSEALAHDRHFEKAGFVALLRA